MAGPVGEEMSVDATSKLRTSLVDARVHHRDQNARIALCTPPRTEDVDVGARRACERLRRALRRNRLSRILQEPEVVRMRIAHRGRRHLARRHGEGSALRRKVLDDPPRPRRPLEDLAEFLFRPDRHAEGQPLAGVRPRQDVQAHLGDLLLHHRDQFRGTHTHDQSPRHPVPLWHRARIRLGKRRRRREQTREQARPRHQNHTHDRRSIAGHGMRANRVRLDGWTAGRASAPPRGFQNTLPDHPPICKPNNEGYPQSSQSNALIHPATPPTAPRSAPTPRGDARPSLPATPGRLGSGRRPR